MGKKYIFTIAFVSWMVFVTFSSLFSFGGVHISRFNIPHTDKIVHFIFYFIACILGVLFLRERTRSKMRYGKAVQIMIIATVAFGVLMEVLQYTMTTNRSGDLFDALANTLGSFSGAMATKFFFSNKSRLGLKY